MDPTGQFGSTSTLKSLPASTPASTIPCRMNEEDMPRLPPVSTQTRGANFLTSAKRTAESNIPIELFVPKVRRRSSISRMNSPCKISRTDSQNDFHSASFIRRLSHLRSVNQPRLLQRACRLLFLLPSSLPDPFRGPLTYELVHRNKGARPRRRFVQPSHPVG